MSWQKTTAPGGKLRDIYGKVIDNARVLVDYSNDETTTDRYAALLQVYDYTNGSTDTITIDPSDATATTFIEGTDFNTTTDNATTASNIASAINGTANFSAQAVTGHAYDPYVSIEYTGGGHIDSASSNDTTAWEFQQVNTTNGTIAKIASDDTGTRKNQPVFTDPDGFFSLYFDNRDNFDLLFNKSGVTFDNTQYENITPTGVPGLSYDSANEEVDLNKALNANDNPLQNLDSIDFSNATELTISSGSITVDQTLHTVDTEGDASSDDLATINRTNGENFIILQAANDSRTVNIKHGTGNIVTSNSNDYSLDTTDKVVILSYSSNTSKWHVIGSGGINGLTYDLANDEVDLSKTLNANDNNIDDVASIDGGGDAVNVNDDVNMQDNSITKQFTSQRFAEIPNPKNQIKMKQDHELPSWNKYSGNPIIDNTTLDANGLGFHSVIKASRFLSSPIDDYYMYAAGHDAGTIYLYTAPDPLGPWTLDSDTGLFSTADVSWANTQLSSPDVLWNESTSEFWLYYHSITSGGNQPTGLSKSSDGVTSWTHKSSPVITTGDHDYRWNGISFSYARIIKFNNYYIAVAQCNSSLNNLDAGGRTTNIGVAYSRDGDNWTTAPEPFMSHKATERGPFGPAINMWNGQFLITYQDWTSHDIYAVFSDTLKPGQYTEPVLFLEKSGVDHEANKVASAELFYDDQLYLYYIGQDSADERSINVAVAE